MYAIQNISDESIYVGVKEGARLSGKRGTKHQVLELSWAFLSPERVDTLMQAGGLVGGGVRVAGSPIV